MGRSRIRNLNHLNKYLVGVSTKNKEVAKDIIQAYENNDIKNYKTAENLIIKLGTRGNGPSNAKEKVAKITNTHVVSSIVRRNVKDPKSSTYLYINEQNTQLVFSQLYKNEINKSREIYGTVLKETKAMLNSKQYMKLNIVVFMEIAKIIRDPTQYQLEEGERFGKWYGDPGDGPVWNDVVIRAAKPCSTKTININRATINTVLLKG